MKRCVVGAVTATMLAACDPGSDVQQRTGETFSQYLIENASALLDRHEVPGAAIALIADGRVAWESGFGLADRERGIPVGADTVFNVASMSKPATAWGIMSLLEAGRLDLDEPIEQRLTRWRFGPSEFSSTGVTARRLLSHTAGLSMPSIPGFPEDVPLPSLEDTLSGNYSGSIYAPPGSAVELLKPPGSGFAYSGGGYVLLQLLIEEITGTRFDAYMQHAVLQPLGMRASRFGWDPSLAPSAAAPHLRSGRPERLFRFTGTAGAGLYATAGDMARLLAANLGCADAPGRGLLQPVTVDTMLSPVTGVVGDPFFHDDAMALGFFVNQPRDELTLISHAGGNAGWRSFFVAARESCAGIVILTNSDKGGAFIREVECAWERFELGLPTRAHCAA